MKFKCNEKDVEIKVNKKVFMRHAIKTHFVNIGESYIDIIDKYAKPLYKEGDIISISEKIISLCQGRIVKREDMKISLMAKVLSKFASHPDCGVGVGETIKMQYAIDKAGALKVLYASVASAITKLFGKKGIFYEIVGSEVSGLDGFYDHIWSEYRDIGIEIPDNPSGVCNEIYEKLGIKSMIVDANDAGIVILGHCDNIGYTEEELIGMIKDNPAGQGQEKTPLVLIREKVSIKNKIKNKLRGKKDAENTEI